MCGATIGAGVENAIGVVDAAGIGRVSGASDENFGDSFPGTTTTDPPPAPAGAGDGLDVLNLGKFLAHAVSSPLAERVWVTASRSTSFYKAWLVSGREHLPGLVFNSVAIKDINSGVNSDGISGARANSTASSAKG